MVENEIRTYTLEKHITKDIHDDHVNGALIPVWRNWDKTIKINPEMAVKNKASRVIRLHQKMGIAIELSKDENFTYFEISRENFFLKKNFYNKIGYRLKESAKFIEHFGIKD